MLPTVPARPDPRLAALLTLIAWLATGSLAPSGPASFPSSWDPPGASDPSHPPDPFAPGIRFTLEPDPSRPSRAWIPRDAAFLDGGELLWAAPSGRAPGLLLIATSELEPAAPLLAHDLPGALGPVRVAAGDEAGELFALAQYRDPDGARRRTEVQRFLPAFREGAPRLELAWTRELEGRTSGPAYLSCASDGSSLAVAVASAPGDVQVDWLDPSTGAVVERHALAGSGIRALRLCADGRRAVVGAGSAVYVVASRAPTPLFQVAGAFGEAVAIDGPGQRVALGEVGLARVYEEGARGFSLVREVRGAPVELAARVALARDGSTLAVAWWNFATGVGARVEMIDIVSGETVAAAGQAGLSGDPQNYPAALALSGTGRRAVVGLWGLADERPELLLLERGRAQPLLELDLPGSVYALALDEDGTRLAGLAKSVHAGDLAADGAIHLADTGERRVQLVRAARRGGSLEVAVLAPGAGAVTVAAGFPSAAPAAHPAAGGVLWIDLTRPHVVERALVGGSGRARFAFALPQAGALFGERLVVQAAFADGACASLLDPVVFPLIF